MTKISASPDPTKASGTGDRFGRLPPGRDYPFQFVLSSGR